MPLKTEAIAAIGRTLSNHYCPQLPRLRVTRAEALLADNVVMKRVDSRAGRMDQLESSLVYGPPFKGRKVRIRSVLAESAYPR